MNVKHHALMCACLILAGAANAQEKKNAVTDFAWLAGCWDGSSAGREYLEQWMKPSGQIMLGMSRSVINGKTREYEFVQIREQDGGIFYVAKPSGQAEASFKLVKNENHEAIFENPQHDFPQRIIYKLEKDGSLAAAIEGMSKGQLKRIGFPMRRAKCDDQATTLQSSSSASPAAAGSAPDSLIAALEKKIAGQEQKPAEEVFKNIQLFKGMPAIRVLRIMSFAFTPALGVECSHCHVIEQWEKDDKAPKQTARQMWQMMGKLKQDLNGIFNDANRTVNCYSCHRGAVKPALSPPAK